jgi:hypothetical protein
MPNGGWSGGYWNAMLWVSAPASDAEREARLAELPFHPLSHSTNRVS